LLVLLDRAAWPPAIVIVAAPVAILVGWLSVGVVGGDAVGARFDPERETVLLWGVHEAFKRAVEVGQRSDPALPHRQAE
jgi:hypothetical protein